MHPTQDSALFCATYISRIAVGLTQAQLARVVHQSERRNKVELLSGFLLRAGKNFVQYLEGPRPAVTACLQRIELDRRHYHMELLAVSSLDTRRFPTWSMGFFVGDIGGTDRLDQVLTQWCGTDGALLEEVRRIGAVVESANIKHDALLPGPFDVLLRHSAQHA